MADASGSFRTDIEVFGELADGTVVHRYSLANNRGMAVRVLTYGAIVQSMEVPDRHGQPANVVLGFATPDDYVRDNRPYFGAVVGRHANRIANGTFALDGTTYRLPINDPPNSLHGGTEGFDKRVWQAEPDNDGDDPCLRLVYESADGEMGYPGTLTALVRYSLTPRNELRIDYRATTDAPTVVNLTNHSYFNLSGEAAGTITGHQLQLQADRYNPTDATQIPTGELAPVAGSPFDFRSPRAIGERIADDHEQLRFGQGYDHNFVLNRPPANRELLLAATVTDPATGRVLELLTREPGVQFYSGNQLDGTVVGTGGQPYRRRGGFALEAQHFPDAPNHPQFPSTVLRPGQVYQTTTIYRLSISAAEPTRWRSHDALTSTARARSSDSSPW